MSSRLIIAGRYKLYSSVSKTF